MRSMPSAPTPGDSIMALQQLRQLSAQRNRGRPATDSELKELEDEPACLHCGGFHSRACPRVRSVSWHPTGVIAQVVYWPWDKVDWSGVLWEDVTDTGPSVLLADLEDDLNILIDRLLYPSTMDSARRGLVSGAAQRLRLLIETAKYGAVESGA